VNSTVLNDSGASTVTPPAVGMCSADQVVLMAAYAAPWTGTGLPIAGTATPIRLRRPVVAGTTGTTTGTTTGAFSGALPVQTTDQREFAVAGAPTEHISSTPGDLPPEDPLG